MRQSESWSRLWCLQRAAPLPDRAGARVTPPGRDSGAGGSRVPVPVPLLRRITPAPRAHRIDGQGRGADNAVMESFFSLLQKNVRDRQRWFTRQDLGLAITIWINRIAPTAA